MLKPVRVTWLKEGGVLPDRAVDDGRGILVIRDIRITDAGKYICQATDGYTVLEDAYVLNVEGKQTVYLV